MGESDPRDNPRAVAAAQRVLLELWTLLGEFREAMTVVGGSAPPLIIETPREDPYVGTTDVDLVVDPLEMPEEAYRTIAEHLLRRGYRQDAAQPFRWYREVLIDGAPVEVEVDLLAPTTTRRGRRHRTEELGGEGRARRTEGAELLRERESFMETPLSGVLPDGRNNQVTLRVARPAALLILKALALAGRDKPKDCYDIDYILAHAPGGISPIAADIAAFGSAEPVRKALAQLTAKFQTVDSYGPQSVAQYRRLTLHTSEADACQAGAYARVARLLRLVGPATVGE